jgi:putative transposase
MTVFSHAGRLGIADGGKPVFIGLAPSSGESADAWHDFLADLTGRGVPSPLFLTGRTD